MADTQELPSEPVERRIAVGADGAPQEVRFFSDAGLQASIDSALANLSENSAILKLEQNPSGFNAIVAAKLNGHWSVAVAYQRSDWGDSLGTEVKFSWA